MASQKQVKQYLAYWFQLGKKVVIGNGVKTMLPQSVIVGDRYSDAFEECWRQITSTEAGDCYLEGTNETIAELLTPNWEMAYCARCTMPVPTRGMGMPAELCPCSDLPNWPNLDVPLPRDPVNTQLKLQGIRDRVLGSNQLSSN